jgi:hypothetical protein
MANNPRRAELARPLSPACRKVQQRLVFLEELPGAEAAALQAHLGACGNCGRIERLFRGFLAVLRDVPAPEANDPYWDRLAETIMARIRAAPPPERTDPRTTTDALERARPM